MASDQARQGQAKPYHAKYGLAKEPQAGSAPVSGGVRIDIYGIGLGLDLKGGARGVNPKGKYFPRVTVGGKNCTDVRVDDHTHLSCDLPKGDALGPAAVVVTVADQT